MMRSLLIAVLVVAGLSGCSSPTDPAPTRGGGPTAYMQEAKAAIAEAHARGSAWTPTDQQITAGGQGVCTDMATPGSSHATEVAAVAQLSGDQTVAEKIVSAAERQLCTGSSYAGNAVPAPVAAPVVLAPATPITARDWLLVAKNPAAHVGQRIIVHGKVTQFDSGTGTSAFRANVDGVAHKVKYGYVDYQTNTMLTGDATALANVVQGDLFTAEVTVVGPYTYATTMGGQMTAPLLNVTKLTVTGHIAH